MMSSTSIHRRENTGQHDDKFCASCGQRVGHGAVVPHEPQDCIKFFRVVLEGRVLSQLPMNEYLQLIQIHPNDRED